MTLTDYSIEVDYNNSVEAWFILWHDNCGQYLIEDYARRMIANLQELTDLCITHSQTCDR